MIRWTMQLMRRLGGDCRGAALIEFAMTLPFMVMLFVGAFQFSDATFAYRKLTNTTRTIADLTSQYQTVNDNDLDVILNASQQVLAPFPVSRAQLTVTQVSIDGSGGATVVWSRSKNTTAYSPGDWFYIPVASKQNNTTVIVAETQYNYLPVIGSALIGPIVLKDRVYMIPRRSVTVTRTTT